VTKPCYIALRVNRPGSGDDPTMIREVALDAGRRGGQLCELGANIDGYGVVVLVELSKLLL
jgi:hypothetical protein